MFASTGLTARSESYCRLAVAVMVKGPCLCDIDATVQPVNALRLPQNPLATFNHGKLSAKVYAKGLRGLHGCSDFE
jgi:hypothetical protein